MILDDIIALATDDKTRITVVLRKCLVLAHALKNDRLKTWSHHELNGYEEVADLPSYRMIVAGAKGNFVGPWQSQWNGVPIPPQVLEEAHRCFAETVLLTQAIAAYEDMVNLPAEGTLTIPWSETLALYYQRRIPNTKQMFLVNAWQEIPKSVVVELLDTVRNRVLSLALELKGEVGEADLTQPSAAATETIEKTVVQQIFGETIYVASGQASIHVQNTTLTPGDWDQLAKTLGSSGIAPAEISDLSEAIAADKTLAGLPFGNKVLDWIKKQAPNVLSGGVKIGASVGQSLLTEYLKQHYGIH